jgi:phosphoglycolate phosphatase
VSGFIFDMDGTLLRLEVDIEEVRTRLHAMFAALGVRKAFRPILPRIHEAAAEASAGIASRHAELLTEGLAILSHFEVVAAGRCRAREGAPQLIAELAARGARLGLVTDNGHACVQPALAHAGIDATLFAEEAIVTRDDVDAPKPDPAGIVHAARALGVHSVWYVGDHPRDVEAARAARTHLQGVRLRVAALRGGLATPAQLEKAGADAILDDLNGVLTLPREP